MHGFRQFVETWETHAPGVYLGYRGATPQNALSPRSGVIYVAQNRRDAEIYSLGKGGRVYRVRVTVRKPFDLSIRQNAEVFAGIENAARSGDWNGQVEGLLDGGATYVSPKEIGWLTQNGYDAILSSTESGGAGTGKVLTVFNPAQVQIVSPDIDFTTAT